MSSNFFNTLSRRFKTLLIYSRAFIVEVETKNDYFKCIRFDREELIKLKSGLKIEVQSRRCLNFLNSIFFNKIYGVPNQEKIIIDIGANKGFFSIFFAHQLKEKGVKIYSFEPHPNTFELFQRNIHDNGLEKTITAFQKSVSGVSHLTQKFYVARDSFDYSLYNEYKSDEEVLVENITLQEIIKQNNIEQIDLLKLNCEGAEYEILMRTPIEYLEKIQSIRMEYHNFELDGKVFNILPLIRFLTDNNFKVVNQLPYAEEHGIIWFENQKR